MRNLDNCYGIYSHNDHILKFFNFSVAFIDILKTQDRINRKGSIVYDSLFSEWERTFSSGIAVLKRRTDFICGRLAAKKAVRKELLKNAYYGADQKRNFPFYKDVEIRRTVTGKPVVFIKDGKSRHGSSDYYVSISHTQEVAAAFVTAKYGCKGIGIDIEKIEERHSSFLDIAFTEYEIKKLKDTAKETGSSNENDKYQEEIARYWTIKEAVMKSMGIGVNIDIKDIEVVEAGSQTARVELKNEAMKRFKLLEGYEIKVEYARSEGFVISLACLF